MLTKNEVSMMLVDLEVIEREALRIQNTLIWEYVTPLIRLLKESQLAAQASEEETK